MAGNMMKNYEQQILSLTEDERNELVLQCIRSVVLDEAGGVRFNDGTVFAILLSKG